LRFQRNFASCGTAALANALEALGIRRTEDELAPLCDSNVEGTSPKGILKAIKAISTTELPLRGDSLKTSEPLAWVLVQWYLVNEGRPMILCVDEDDHWVAVVGSLGDRVVVIDGAETDLVLFYDKDGLIERWRASDGRFYAVIL